MPHEVRMPQLGMTQDSGVIVSWLKGAGDAVAEGDALLEVETDKATMEVEAHADGFLAGVRAGEGDDVPVGDVIALIVASEAEVGEHVSEGVTVAAPEPQSAPEVASEPAPSVTPGPTPAPAQPAPARNGKVLASPKAKRLALEQGIDLAALRAQGVAEPIHAADLSRVNEGGQSLLFAEVSGAALDGLLERSEEADRSTLLASFAAGAWRAVFEDPDVGIAVRTLDGGTYLVGDAAERPALSLVDLCDTRLSGYAPAGGGPALTVARKGEAYALTLSYSDATMPMAYAAALLNDIAARVEDPIRQLL